MDVVVTVEHRFYRTPEGSVWTTGLNDYRFWARYLDVFEKVKVVARVQNIASPGPGDRRANGPGVVFFPVPDYLGPWQYLKKHLAVRRALRSAVERDDAVIMRVGSHLAGRLERELVRFGHPFALEVVGDPYGAYAPGSVRHWLRPWFRWFFRRQLQRQCSRSVAVAYVTGRALQSNYPTAGFSIGVSDVDLPDAAIRFSAGTQAARHNLVEQPRCLISVGSLAQMYKATDVLLRAMASCVRRGLDLALVILGDGRHRPELERLALELGLGERVRFLGHLPAGEAVRAQLDQADLFVLPSREESLPRALVEAMARALPCIGSNVGGIPELLPPEDLVPAGDADALARKIEEVLTSPVRMAVMSARNLERCRDYRNDLLAERRRVFFRQVRGLTASRLHGSAPTESLSEIGVTE